MAVKVFISWSGEPSRSIARALHDWLPKVAQHVRPWMSDAEIESGKRWNDEIAKSLEDTDFGIVCVTTANQHKPWLMFEAGALAKRLDVGRVVPLRIDLTSAQVKEPLASFQGCQLNATGMKKLVQDIMGKAENPLTPEQVTDVFEDAWPRFETKLTEVMQKSTDVKTPPRQPDEMLEELVERVRRIENDHGWNVVHEMIRAGMLRAAAGELARAITEAEAHNIDPELMQAAKYVEANYGPK